MKKWGKLKMTNLIYIGSFSRLLRCSFGDKIPEGFLSKNLPFIIHDYDEMKRHCSDICVKLDYEYMNDTIVLMFVQKWKHRLRDYNQTFLDEYWKRPEMTNT